MSPDPHPLQRVLPISPGRRQDLLDDAVALASAGCSQLLLREPHRNRWAIEQHLPELKRLLPGLILHATNVNAWRFAEIYQTGLHLPSHLDPKTWRSRYSGRLGISCHGLDELKRAEEAGLDYALLSPVFDPLSKPATSEALGPETCAEFQANCQIKIFGLGGIQVSNAASCRSLYGVASMGYLFGKRTDRRRLSARTKRLLQVFEH